MDRTWAGADELIDLISFRRDRFGLVADVFARESSEETVTQMIARASTVDQKLDESIESTLNEGLAALACGDASAFATKTRTEYARLFLGPREVVAPLHESAYLSGTPRMFTRETLAVRAFFERYGYVMKAKNREPEDSASVEFEFLRRLCDRCLELLEGGVASKQLEEVGHLLKAQRAFEGQHLGMWAREFAARVVEGDESGFYAVWAGYLCGVLDEDAELLDECGRLLGECAGLSVDVEDVG